MVAPTYTRFNPLVDLDGLWTTDLAEQFLPIDGMPPAKYECVDGKLLVSPYEAAPNTHAAAQLMFLTKHAARKVGLRVYTTVNLRLGFQRWLQPDFAVLRNPVPGVWAEIEDAVIVGEFISPSSRKRDRIDKPALCAEAGIPYYLYGTASLKDHSVSLCLSRLDGDHYVPIAQAWAGEPFEMREPFEVAFDPIELLDL